jgi:hypothetical protein
LTASSIRRYLDRYACREPLFDEDPAGGIGIIVVVPCYDEPRVIDTLESLSVCPLPDCAVEVLVIINHPEGADKALKERSRATFDRINHWADTNRPNGLSFYATTPLNLPARDAGVGLARKIGMDEAVWRYDRAGVTNGLIANLDADCTCAPNYLQELYETMIRHSNFNGASIYFEHPLQDLGEPLRNHIIDYELHLRCHTISLSTAHYPFAFHTVGSSMVVTLRAYTAQGGMNKRKAGEDFYFLHKIFPHGGFYNINSTVVYPAARLSDKVPFGTGAALTKMAAGAHPHGWKTYHPESYRMLGEFLSKQTHFFFKEEEAVSQIIDNLPACIRSYLGQCNAPEQILRIRKSTTKIDAFTKAFYRWFDGLKILRFFNHSAKHGFPNQEVRQVASALVWQCTGKRIERTEGAKLLNILRAYERSGE